VIVFFELTAIIFNSQFAENFVDQLFQLLIKASNKLQNIISKDIEISRQMLTFNQHTSIQI